MGVTTKLVYIIVIISVALAGTITSFNEGESIQCDLSDGPCNATVTIPPHSYITGINFDLNSEAKTFFSTETSPLSLTYSSSFDSDSKYRDPLSNCWGRDYCFNDGKWDTGGYSSYYYLPITFVYPVPLSVVSATWEVRARPASSSGGVILQCFDYNVTNWISIYSFTSTTRVNVSIPTNCLGISYDEEFNDHVVKLRAKLWGNIAGARSYFYEEQLHFEHNYPTQNVSFFLDGDFESYLVGKVFDVDENQNKFRNGKKSKLISFHSNHTDFIELPKRANVTSANIEMFLVEEFINDWISIPTRAEGIPNTFDGDFSTGWCKTSYSPSIEEYEFKNIENGIIGLSYYSKFILSHGDCNIYIFNFTNSSWDKLYTCNAYGYYNKAFTPHLQLTEGINDYVNPSNNLIKFKTEWKGSCHIATSVYYESEILLMTNNTNNPYLMISDFGSWSHDGKVVPGELLIISNITNYLNQYLNDCESDNNGLCQVPLTFGSDSSSAFNISKIDINYSLINSPNTNLVKLNKVYSGLEKEQDTNLSFYSDYGTLLAENFLLTYSPSNSSVNSLSVQENDLVFNITDLNKDQEKCIFGNETYYFENEDDMTAEFTLHEGNNALNLTCSDLENTQKTYLVNYSYYTADGEVISPHSLNTQTLNHTRNFTLHYAPFSTNYNITNTLENTNNLTQQHFEGQLHNETNILFTTTLQGDWIDETISDYSQYDGNTTFVNGTAFVAKSYSWNSDLVNFTNVNVSLDLDTWNCSSNLYNITTDTSKGYHVCTKKNVVTATSVENITQDPLEQDYIESGDTYLAVKGITNVTNSGPFNFNAVWNLTGDAEVVQNNYAFSIKSNETKTLEPKWKNKLTIETDSKTASWAGQSNAIAYSYDDHSTHQATRIRFKIPEPNNGELKAWTIFVCSKGKNCSNDSPDGWVDVTAEETKTARLGGHLYREANHDFEHLSQIKYLIAYTPVPKPEPEPVSRSSGGGGGGSYSTPSESTKDKIRLKPQVDEVLKNLIAPESSEDASKKASEKLSVQRTFDYEKQGGLTSTFIEEEIVVATEVKDLVYVVEIPFEFEDPEEINVESSAENYTVLDSKIVLFFGDSSPGETHYVKLTTKKEIMAYQMNEIISEMSAPTIFASEEVQQNFSVPEVKQELVTEKVMNVSVPLVTNATKETANVTGLITFNPLFSLFALIPLGALAAMKLKPKRPSPPQKKLEPIYRNFPSSEWRRIEVVKSICKSLDIREGGFHAARVWKEIENIYGAQENRIDIEKWIGKWLRESDEISFERTIGRKKIYKFKKQKT